MLMDWGSEYEREREREREKRWLLKSDNYPLVTHMTVVADLIWRTTPSSSGAKSCFPVYMYQVSSLTQSADGNLISSSLLCCPLPTSQERLKPHELFISQPLLER